MIKFDLDELKLGMILHVRTYAFVGRSIRKVLSCRGKNPVWGNHDAMILRNNCEWAVGESEPMKAKFTPLSEYESRVNAGKCELKVYDIVEATNIERQEAAEYWKATVLGTPYDFMAFPRLFLKNWVMDVFDTDVGWEWAHWCTEGVAHGWDRGAGKVVWGKKNPTPWTTEKRVGTTLVDVTDKVIKEV